MASCVSLKQEKLGRCLYPRGEGGDEGKGGDEGEGGGKGGDEWEGGGEGEGGVEGEGKLIIRCIFCSQIDRPITKGLIRGGLQHPLPLLPLKNFCFNLHEAASL